MPKVTLVQGKEKKEIEVVAGEVLRNAAKKNGVETNPGMSQYVNCFGNGMCGTCWMLVEQGMENLGPKTTLEKFTLWHSFCAIGNEDKIRLACQCKVNGDCSVTVCPPMNWSGETFWQKPYPNK